MFAGWASRGRGMGDIFLLLEEVGREHWRSVNASTSEIAMAQAT